MHSSTRCSTPRHARRHHNQFGTGRGDTSKARPRIRILGRDDHYVAFPLFSWGLSCAPRTTVLSVTLALRVLFLHQLDGTAELENWVLLLSCTCGADLLRTTNPPHPRVPVLVGAAAFPLRQDVWRDGIRINVNGLGCNNERIAIGTTVSGEYLGWHPAGRQASTQTTPVGRKCGALS